MTKICTNLYKSSDLNVKPRFKILSLEGFNPSQYSNINGSYHPLNAISEPKIHFVIAKMTELFKRFRLSDYWRCTEVIPNNGKFNEEVEFTSPYKEYRDFHCILFVLSSNCYSKDGYLETRFLKAGYLTLFNSKGVFRRGIYEIELYDLDINTFKKIDSISNIVDNIKYNGKPKSILELNRLLKLMRKKIRGELQSVPNEQKSITEVEQRIHELKRQSHKVFLSVEFQQNTSNSFPVVLEIPKMPPPKLKTMRNPVERAHISMTRNSKYATKMQKDSKPNMEQMINLKDIIKRSLMSPMTDGESDLLWQFRYYLCDHMPNGLSKLMQAVKWQFQENTDLVKEILMKWPHLNPEYFMELLTPRFTSQIVRRYAVKQLESATDKDLFLYLFHLVQALRYENMDDIFKVESGKEPSKDSVSESPGINQIMSSLQSLSMQISQSNFNDTSIFTRQSSTVLPESSFLLQEDLATFLIRRCKQCRKLSTHFYWFLILESEHEIENNAEYEKNEIIRQMYKHILDRFKTVIEEISNDFSVGRLSIMENIYDLDSQRDFVNKLKELCRYLHDNANKSAQKNDLLKSKLPEILGNDINFILPLDPDFVVTGIDYSGSAVFKSSQYPIKLRLLNSTNQSYTLLFKEGDDLRQDQIVLQMINFMDEILRREKFDLKLIPYKVLATGSKSGFIEFIESKSVTWIDNEMQSIHKYLISISQFPESESVDEQIMTNYISSMAGYSVITYLLGVGDRHLDNIMITPKGHLFHIDFGYVLGNDPKPMPPQVRITKGMYDALGKNEAEFCKLAFDTFIYLRRHANQCLSLLSLIGDARIGDFQSSQKVVQFVEDRFMLDLSEENAIISFAERLASSIKAVIPGIMEKFHKLAMMRK